MDEVLKCSDCHMVFNSHGLLNKHRAKFCVGGSVGDPYHLTQGQMTRPGNTGLQWELDDRELAAAKVAELETLKHQKAHQRHNQYLKDRHMLDLMNTSRSHDTDQLTSEHDIDDYMAQNEMSPRVSRERDWEKQRLRLQAANHSKNVTDYQSRGRDLQRQKEDISRKIDELSTQPDITKQLLIKLQDQEQQNKETLTELKEQLTDMQLGRTGAGPDSLVAEIRAMRQSYLKRGGNNPDVLNEISEMENEALSMETRNAKLSSNQNSGNIETDSLRDKVISFELENRQLQDKLKMLQGYDQEYTTRTSYDESMYRENERKHQEHLKRLQELQQEMEMVKQKAKLDTYRSQLEASTKRQPPVVPEPSVRIPPLQTDADMPALMTSRYPQPVAVPVDPLAPAPYDPNAGFVVFYDFVLGLEPSVQTVRLVVGLYNTAGGMGEPTMLPTVYSQPSNQGVYGQVSNQVIIRARQPIPRCPPTKDLSIVVEIQASSMVSQRLTTRGWAKFDLFDGQQRVISGRWKIPLRVAPVQPTLSSADVNTVPQYGAAELHYRVVNFRDADNQSLIMPSPQDSSQYMHPPQASSAHFPMPHNPTSPSPPQSPHPQYDPGPRLRDPEDPDFNTIGFQVDRVKHAEKGEGKVRITAYHKRTGQIVQSSTSAVVCSTAAVKDNYKNHYHIFGQQEAVFVNVDLQPDIIVLVKFYLRHRTERTGQMPHTHTHDDETLVGWTYVPLLISGTKQKTPTGKKMRRSDDMTGLIVNTGTHTLQLLVPPIPALAHVPTEDRYHPEKFTKYGLSNIRIHIFQSHPRPGSLSDSEASDDEMEIMPKDAYIKNERVNPPVEPFTATDAFDLYIDSCKLLPDSVTVTRIAGRLLDRKYDKVGKDISALPKLDSDIYNPVYNSRIEFREPNLPPSATLLLKVYTIDTVNRYITVVGYATLNVFVESGTERQPLTDQGGIQVSLNEGGHQLRLYQTGPNPGEPLTEPCLREKGSRRVPCASLLVRLHKAPIGPQGKPLEAEKIPQTDWARMGLWKPRPMYKDRSYYNNLYEPSLGESKLFHALVTRSTLTTREAVHQMADGKEARQLKNEKSIEKFLKDRLTKMMDDDPLDVDLNLIAKYSPKAGIKVALDSASHLPWNGFTYAHVCLNPPASFYMGPPNAAYDKPIFVQSLDLSSTNKFPRWTDGLIHFPDRCFQRHMTLIIHLQEIQVAVREENYSYSLLDEAWTAVQVFTGDYVYTEPFQLPLFHGHPTQSILSQLTREPCKDWLVRATRSGVVRMAQPAFVTVRLCDGRREEEVPPADADGMYAIPYNNEFMPPHRPKPEAADIEPRLLQTMVPPGKITEEFFHNLAVKYRNLVYKLYDEGSVGK